MKEFQRLHGAFPPGRSQNREDDYILAYFGDFVGRFLDVGAMDGITISNTYALAQKGWKGVCVEPDPQALEGLARTHGDNPNIVIAPVAISTCGGFQTFYNSRSGGVSTLSKAHRDKWASETTYDAIEVLTITPETLLEKHPGPYEFFNLDVEGLNAGLFSHFPLSDMGTELVCVEHDGECRRILNHCARHGLKRVAYDNAENMVIGK